MERGPAVGIPPSSQSVARTWLATWSHHSLAACPDLAALASWEGQVGELGLLPLLLALQKLSEYTSALFVVITPKVFRVCLKNCSQYFSVFWNVRGIPMLKLAIG